MPDCQPATEAAKEASANWLRSHANGIGALLPTGDSDRTGFALGAILKWPPWSAVAADCWESLVSPWIAAHCRLPEARCVFGKPALSRILGLFPGGFAATTRGEEHLVEGGDREG